MKCDIDDDNLFTILLMISISCFVKRNFRQSMSVFTMNDDDDELDMKIIDDDLALFPHESRNQLKTKRSNHPLEST